MSTEHIPVIDIGAYTREGAADRAAVASEVAAACREIGFLVVTGHGVPKEQVDGVYEATVRYFEGPARMKEATARPAPGQIRGYSGMEAEGLGLLDDQPAPPDLKESFDIGPLEVDLSDPYYGGAAAGQHFASNLWPDTDGFEPAYRAYYASMEAVARTMMTIFADALALPAEYFLTAIDRHISILRSNYYPRQLQPPKPGQLRAGAHTDYTALTILWQEDVPGGGLEVRTREGRWIPVPAVPGSFVVNLGDSMMRWTNDTWRSTMHRVVNPSSGAASAKARVSLAYFVQPNYDAVIACIPSCTDEHRPPLYPPIPNGDFLHMKFMQQNTLVPEAS